MSRVITLAGVSVLVVALVLGMAVPALAAPNPSSWVGDLESELLRGEVISIGDQEFVIQSGEEELTIAVADETRYYQMLMPAKLMALARHRLQLYQENQLALRERAGNGNGHGWGAQNQLRAAVQAHNQQRLQNRVAHQMERAPLLVLCWLRGFCPFGGQAEFADIAVGDSVVVLAEDSLARVVLIIKPTAYASVSGTVTDIDSSFITIDSDDGPQVTLSYDESTVFVLSGFYQLETGQYVRIIYFDGIAKRVVVCPQAS